jgi:hypothetical protein
MLIFTYTHQHQPPKMKTTALLLLCFVFTANFCSGQMRNPALDINRTNIWRFGFASALGANDVPGLDFTNGTPIVINSGTYYIRQGATSVSSITGNLQLYGGYQSVYDFTNNPLMDAGVVGDSGWIGISPCNIAIPMPKSANLIYYFSTSVTLKYTVVDMAMNNGQGRAILRNVEVEPYPAEAKLAAVHHCNGSDIWIVGHRWGTNTFYAYLLTDTGLSTTPTITSIGPIANETGTYQAGKIKFSPNGKKLAIVFNGVDTLPCLLDFDKTTGVISNPILLQKDEGDQGLSFSPDNSKLYISTNNGRIVQYNLLAGSATDIINSRKVVLDEFTTFSNLQIGRDGRIYVGTDGNPHRKYLTVIHNPNNLDTLCNPQLDAIYLNGGQGHSHSLMNTVESYFYTGLSAYPCYADTFTNISNIVNKNGLALTAYPNPFSDYTYVDVLGVEANEKLTYQLSDLTGRILEAQIIASDSWEGKRAVLHKARLPSGIYLLTVKTPNRSQTIKLSVL